MALSSDAEADYAKIIDGILAVSDINTISASRIRKGLQAAVNEDLESQKAAIKELIIERFNKFTTEQDSISKPPEEPTTKPSTNGHTDPTDSKANKTPQKRTRSPERVASGDEDDADLSEVVDYPVRKKTKRKTPADDDAIFAAKLQAEENSRARPTRGGATKKRVVVKKKAAPKKKPAKAVKAEGDSEIGSDSDVESAKEVKRTGGFHKAMNLSAPLSSLLDGEVSLSRPQTVKRIWAYIKERDLQDPNDKREIRCDDQMKAVFKSDRVHMFTMNKLLNQHLFPVEEQT
ncbi:MAG: hypothetical protein M1812_004680 [Candelaria pacifica]|nr:MAG: hypothetical protein M1812_004680 [Candelaria pacifica]